MGPRGEGAGLVEDDGAKRVHPLERFAATNEQAKLGTATGGDKDGDGGGESERARAGDNKHGDSGNHRRSDAVAGKEPAEEGRDRDRDDRRHEHRRDPIRQALNGRLITLRLVHELEDLSEHRLVTGAPDPHPKRRRAVHCAPDHLVRDRFCDRHRLTGNHRLIDDA